jgi:pimeloyl-ACP methyl ester carboxylesterase
MPTYYIMDRDADMAATVAPDMPSPDAIAACRWLPEEDLRVYTDEFARTGFQAALLWYRARTSGRFVADSAPYAGRGIAQPACFIAGASDWGPYQRPGELRRMAGHGFADNRGIHFIPGAGHWVQQEQPAETVRLLKEFLTGL